MDQTAAEWASRIRSCRGSGLSVRQWCIEHQISAQTYYRWLMEGLSIDQSRAHRIVFGLEIV